MRFLSLALALLVSVPGHAVAQEITAAEFAQRRQRILSKVPDGLLLLHARSSEAALDQHNFKQESTFFYFTGLANQPAAILVLDGPRREARLFVPPEPTSFGFKVEGVSLEPGEDSGRRHGLDRVERWEEFVPFVRSRLAEGVSRLYVDESRRPEMTGNPEPLWPVAAEKLLWQRSLAQAFPGVRIDSAASLIRELRWIKSPGEMAALRKTARATVAALLAGIRAIRPGRSQRESEAAVVSGCIEAGAEGPAFWPWTMSGPNAHVSLLVRALYDYHHLNRTMQAGELVRVDVGCDLNHYEGDVGRTVPVSGRFDPGQRETWDLLIRAYRRGLSVMRAGVTITEVMQASRDEISRARSQLETDQARQAASSLLSSGGMDIWGIHGVGLDGGEASLERLEAGSVIAFEPMFSVGKDAFYLEDMIVVMGSGHEILSAGLPYTAEEIEAVMRDSRSAPGARFP